MRPHRPPLAPVPPLTTAHHFDDAFHITSHVSQTPVVVGVVVAEVVAVPSLTVATDDSSSRTFFALATSPEQRRWRRQLLQQLPAVLSHTEANGRQEVVPVSGRSSSRYLACKRLDSN